MEFEQFSRLFCDSCAKNGIKTPTDEQIKLFYRFDGLLHETNRVTNLTAIRTTEEAIPKHYVDSLLGLDLFAQGAHVLDLGCGAGFPSIPLAIMRPDLTITALDSTAKKIAFVQRAATELGLSNLTPISGRAEDRTLMQKLGQFDAVTGRAVAGMAVFSELCLPYVKIGGKFIAMKGARGEEELAEAGNAIPKLGGVKKEVRSCSLALPDGQTEARCLVIAEKTKQTPPQYPRAYATILKKPLS